MDKEIEKCKYHSINNFTRESVALREQEGTIPERWFKEEDFECQTKDYDNCIAPDLIMEEG